MLDLLAICTSSECGLHTFPTVAFSPVFLNPLLMSPDKTCTLLPSISLVGTSFSKFPYTVFPSLSSNRINRSNADIALTVVLKQFTRRSIGNNDWDLGAGIGLEAAITVRVQRMKERANMESGILESL